MAERYGNAIKLAVAIAAIAVVAYLMRDILGQLMLILLEAGAVALVLNPLCRLYERKLPRSISAILSIATVFVIAVIATAYVIPEIIDKLKAAYGLLSEISGYAEKLGIDISMLGGAIGSLGKYASNAVSGISRLAIAASLAIFILIDRERIALRLELLVPYKKRDIVADTLRSVYTELEAYVRGQLIISSAVGVLSSIGLTAIGVPSAVGIGLMAGALNIVPYVGPILACVPAVIIALSEGFITAVMSVVILVAVQQVDGLVLSPRIMSSVTGFSPAVVIISIFTGGIAGGIIGMLIAIPAIIAARTCIRVFVESRRNN